MTIRTTISIEAQDDDALDVTDRVRSPGCEIWLGASNTILLTPKQEQALRFELNRREAERVRAMKGPPLCLIGTKDLRHAPVAAIVERLNPFQQAIESDALVPFPARDPEPEPPEPGAAA